MPKYLGLGTDLHIGQTSNVVYQIGAVQSIEGPGAEHGTGDVTTLDSTAREFLPTIRDGGTVTITVLADDSNDAESHSIFAANYRSTYLSSESYRHFEIHHAGDSSKQIQFKADITGLTHTHNIDDALLLTIEAKITGPIEWPT